MEVTRLATGLWSREHRRVLLDALHDRWFDIDAVRFDERLGTVSLLVGDRKQGPFDREVVFKGVTAFNVEDNANIGYYDIDEIRLEASPNRFVLTSGFPLRLVIQVGSAWEITCGPPNRPEPHAKP